MSLEEDVTRGEEAKSILEHPLFTEAFQTVRTKLFERWEASQSGDHEAREVVWLSVKLLDDVRAMLTNVIATGKFSADIMKAEENEKRDLERAKLRW